ncbi:non-ribosomal peptide synthetase [Streptomyces sp. NRRL F-5727]|uniref:non-ribosomal peptide synthetase n=1 Tax=Streptomyces sp. NRRL F-5727 TaxID=1463871 RepID=UPI00068CA8B6|nr:non-ribosomal peptide synthetase [Streptomyces sp. NRRL F-5727]
MLAEHATRRPGHVAVQDATGAVSYADLWARSAALADRLRSARVARGDVVAVCLERSADTVTACAGVLAAGAAYLLLDPDQPPGRVRELLARSSATALVSRPEHVRRLGLETYDPVDVEAFRDVVGSDAAPPAAVGTPDGPDSPADEDDSLAYVNFTSGSSGRPKGVLIGHRGLRNLVDWYRERYRVGPGDRTTQLARPTFDAFVLETWTALAAGASLHIVPSEAITDPERLRDWFRAEGITVAFAPTALAEQLLALEWPRAEEGCALRDLLVGGDRLTRRPPASLPFRVHNNYGPTENTVVATVGLVEPEPHPGPPSIGRPLPGVTAHVLDAAGAPVADGEPGRLHLGGVGVALGCLDDEDASRFTPDPWAAAPGGRLYDTGDRVVRDPDGRLHYLGREDDQVQIRGFRVEPAEVEAALRADEAVDSAVVVATTGSEPRLIAYAVLRDAAADPREIRARLADRLPDYLVPALVTPVAAFPLTSRGKVDRAALAARPVSTGAERAERPEAGPLSLLATLWAEVLGVPSVAPDDDFFEIGGDSLRLIRLVGKARREGLKIDAEDVYTHPVLSDLARALSPARPGAQGTPASAEDSPR